MRDERGFSLIEVLVACLVLIIGALGLFGTLDVAAHATMGNRQRQAETSLARQVTEGARSLTFSQLTPANLAAALAPLVSGATVSGQGLTVHSSVYTFNVSLNVCSLDDPTDGYGDHSSPPSSGGVWCPDVAPSGTADSNPDDLKRLSVTVTPATGPQPTVQLTTLIYGQIVNGPAVSCLTTTPLTTTGACPGTNLTLGPGSASTLTFYLKTTTQAASVQWLVNGNPPPAAQVPSGATDPYVPTAKSSQFTWQIPTLNGSSIDGTYTISVYAQDSNGATGSRSTLQVTVNEHQATAPTSVLAGYDQQIQGVDVQWLPSSDQDVLYYNVYRQGNAGPVCTKVTGTSCTDLTAPNPGPPPRGPCQSTTTDLGGTTDLYWVQAWDKDTSGNPRLSTATSPTSDANLCDRPPVAPSGLTTTTANGVVTLSWTAPSGTGDPDTGDYIQGWRIYRWAGTAAHTRLAYVGTTSTSPVTSFADSSPDPGGVAQSYCVTSVDTHLNESTCSNVASG